jgi:parallel beta-helix repeat protein
MKDKGAVVKIIKAIIVLSLVFLFSSLYGQNYYVAPAPTGNDAASGLTGAPWATLQYAVNQLSPGDILTVEDGTYVGFYMDHVDGTAAQRITITARNRLGAIINAPPAGQTRNCEFRSCSYVTFDGFEVTLAPGAGIAVRTVEYEYTGINCRDDIVQYCHSHHNSVGDPTGSHDGIFSGFALNFTVQYNIVHDNGEHGIYVSNSADNPVVRGNTIYHNFNNGLHMNSDLSSGGDGIINGWLVEDNVIFANGRTGINCDGDSTGICRNNLVFNNRAGMTLYQIDGAQGASDNLVYNNTFYTFLAADTPNTGSLRASMLVDDASNDNTIFNNIIYSVGAGGTAAFDAGTGAMTGLIHDYNIVARIGGGGGIYSGTSASPHESAPDPSLVFNGAAGADFTLLLACPAVDTGINIYNAAIAWPFDISGTARPQGAGFDMGCYERPAAGTPTFTATALPSATSTATATGTNTPGPSATFTAYVTATETPFYSATDTASATQTRTATPFYSATFTRTITATRTASVTGTPTFTCTITRTNTPFFTPTITPTHQAAGAELRIYDDMLFPNPAYKDIDIKILYSLSGTAGIVTAEVYTIAFRKVLEATASSPAGGEITIMKEDAIRFAPGIYLYRLKAEGGNRTARTSIKLFIILNK